MIAFQPPTVMGSWLGSVLDFTSVVVGAKGGYSELANETGFIKPNPLMLALYLDATHDHDVC
jgi:hypothetical protein